jgi:hypothetical protein
MKFYQIKTLFDKISFKARSYFPSLKITAIYYILEIERRKLGEVMFSDLVYLKLDKK